MLRVAAVVVVALAVPLSGVASAAEVGPSCTRTSKRTGQCEILIGSSPAPLVRPVSQQRNDDVAQERACTDADGSSLPCSDPTWGTWSQDRTSYCRPLSPQPPSSDPRWEGHYPDGVVMECILGPAFQGSLRVGTFWSPSPAAPGVVPALTPAEAAAIVVERMDLRAADIGIVPEDRPGSVGLVGMPVWMWTTPGPTTFGPQTLTGSTGGITITATARVERIVWSMGDGATVTCTSPGTPYRPGYGAGMSPDCGHRYSRTSVGQPGHAYPITATSFWVVDWTGGGDAGRIELDLTAETSIQVGELQVLITRA